MFASARVHPQFLKQIKNQWGLKKVHQGVKYLGVPLFFSNSKKRDFPMLKISWNLKLVAGIARICPGWVVQH